MMLVTVCCLMTNSGVHKLLHCPSRHVLTVSAMSSTEQPSGSVPCGFTNFRCVKISVASDHGAFGFVQIPVSMDAAVISRCIFLI